MLNLGRKQKLTVVKKVEFGIYLGESREAGEKGAGAASREAGSGRDKGRRYPGSLSLP